jgi:hypothetical protein
MWIIDPTLGHLININDAIKGSDIVVGSSDGQLLHKIN